MRAPRAVVEPDERRTDRLGEVHHLVDLLGEHLAERAAEDREVLAEHEHLAAVDRAPSGDHAVGERPVVLDAEAVRPVAGQHVELDERAGVEQQLDALAGGELAPLVLAPDRRLAPGVQRLFLQLRELLEALLDRVRHRSPGSAAASPCGASASTWVCSASSSAAICAEAARPTRDGPAGAGGAVVTGCGRGQSVGAGLDRLGGHPTCDLDLAGLRPARPTGMLRVRTPAS